MRDQTRRPVVELSGASARDDRPLAVLEPLLGPGWHQMPTSLPEVTDTLSRRLRERGAGEPVVLRVEDAHLLDEASSQVLSLLIQQGDVPVVATARGVLGSSVPWFIPGDDVLERIAVRAMGLTEAEEMLATMLGGYATPDTVRRLWTETAGNPFHLREIVRDQRETGALVAHDGIWVWTGARAVGQRLLDLVMYDLTRLSDDARTALEMTALAGPVPVEALLETVPRTALDELLRLGLVRPSPPDHDAPDGAVLLETVHVLYAEAVCSVTGARRRREVLDRAHTWLTGREVTGRGLVRAVALTLHSKVAVSLPRLLTAADTAITVHEPSTAVRLATAALRIGASDGPDRITVLMARADAYQHLGNAEHALRDLAEARRSLDQVTPVDRAVVVARLTASRLEARILHLQTNDVGAALGALDQAESWLVMAAPADLQEQALRLIEMFRLSHLGYAGRHAEMLEPALVMFREVSAPAEVVPLVCPTVYGLAFAGRFDAAERLCLDYLPVATERGAIHRWETGTITLTQFLVRLWRGDLEGAESTMPSDTGPSDWIATDLRRGLLHAARGSWAVARRELRAVNVRLRAQDSLGIGAYTLAVEALTAAAGGDAVGARVLLDEARSHTAAGGRRRDPGDRPARGGHAGMAARPGRERPGGRARATCAHRRASPDRARGPAPDRSSRRRLRLPRPDGGAAVRGARPPRGRASKHRPGLPHPGSPGPRRHGRQRRGARARDPRPVAPLDLGAGGPHAP